MQSTVTLLVALLTLTGVACGSNQPAEERPQPAPVPTLTERDWLLVALGEQASPLGAEQQRLSMRFDTSTVRAVGFAGCNRYSASYALRGDSLTFGPAVSTKMSCGESDTLERSFREMLAATITYQLTDTVFTIVSKDGPLARFRGR